MSGKAYEENCLKCRHHDLLRQGKIRFEHRRCPQNPKRNRRSLLSPYDVRQDMPRNWICSERVPKGGGAR